ncbi:MAG TPA: DNA polymerase IV [Planctomycetota bacterium]|nr:DNA polymerase IV [Planctomycetota bacterium]HRR79484.1 DNA polymerase IV [Planctomycetota bacterium]HRT93322.1 DNA polymerase IV [Planctomycetota bacterium]
MAERVIVHLDMDAFFAAVEQRDRPELRGQPVVVGADPKGGRGRGVVSTCSYEARCFGIRSAMPISEAWRRCPKAVYLPVRMDAYEQASEAVFRVLEEFTPDIEPVSIDEAFLDVTRSLHLFGTKRALGERLRLRIEAETRLTASIGIAPCKMVAKIASDLQKPRGLVIVEPGEAQAFLRPLPVGKLWGVGRRTQEALDRLGIRTIGDLAARPREELVRRFGKQGEDLWDLAHGRDDRPVEAAGEAKSIGHENTFEHDTRDPRLLASTLMELCEGVAFRLRRAGLRGRTITTKLRFEDFTTLTRATTVETPVDAAAAIYQIASANLGRVAMKGHRIRLIGVSVSGFEARPRQLALFGEQPSDAGGREKQRLLADAIDRIKTRFGQDALHQGTTLDRPRDDE